MKNWLIAAAVVILALFLYTDLLPGDDAPRTPPPPPAPVEMVPCIDDGYGNGVYEVTPGVWANCDFPEPPWPTY